MLEVLVPGIRYGDGVISCDTAYRGMICYIYGVNASGKPVLRVPYSSAQAWAAVYPINKIYYAADYADTADAVDKIADESDIIYYEGGTYETDQWYPSTFGITCAYWNDQEWTTSAECSRFHAPGFDTSLATWAGYKCYVVAVQSYVVGNKGTLGAKRGMIAGYASAAGMGAAGTTLRETAGHFAQVIGIHGSSSADARLVFRINPNAIGRSSLI